MNVISEAFQAEIRRRREQIQQEAPCAACGYPRNKCKRERNADPHDGCCDRCHHPSAPGLAALLKSVEDGTFRTVEQVEQDRAEAAAKRAARDAAATPPYGDKPMPLPMKLEQGEWWRTRDEGWIRVVDMQPSHRANLCAWLMRRAGAIADQVGYWELGQFSDAPDDVVDGWLDRDARRMANPQKWIRETPLFRALMSAGVGEQ